MNQRAETTRTTLRMPMRVKRWVQETADAAGISENARIILLLQEKMAAEAVGQK